MIYLSILLILIAFTAKAVMDILAHDKLRSSIFPWYWASTYTWMRKYKNWPKDRRPAFFGSTTFLVWLTDPWHLFQMVLLLTLPIGAYISTGWIELIISLTLGKGWFEFCYKYLFMQSFWDKVKSKL